MSGDLTKKHLAYHDPRRGMVAMEVDYPSGASTGRHSHPSAQLLYAIEGVMTVYSEVGTWVVPPNRAVWLVAGLDHEVRMCGDVKIRTVYVDEECVPELPQASCVLVVSDLLRELLIAAMRVPINYAADTRDARLMRLLLDELREFRALPLHLPMPVEPRLGKICKELVARPDDKSTAAHWAHKFGVTSKTIHRLFAQHTGLTFGQWRQQARLLFALERLAQGERVIDVALDSGYTSPSAFAAMFRKHLGAAPNTFYR
jgi:AraC-like DNA-binding protein